MEPLVCLTFIADCVTSFLHAPSGAIKVKMNNLSTLAKDTSGHEGIASELRRCLWCDRRDVRMCVVWDFNVMSGIHGSISGHNVYLFNFKVNLMHRLKFMVLDPRRINYHRWWFLHSFYLSFNLMFKQGLNFGGKIHKTVGLTRAEFILPDQNQSLLWFFKKDIFRFLKTVDTIGPCQRPVFSLGDFWDAWWQQTYAGKIHCSR